MDSSAADGSVPTTSVYATAIAYVPMGYAVIVSAGEMTIAGTWIDVAGRPGRRSSAAT